MLEIPIVVFIGILLALVFDFGNGLNDAANAVSTIIATRGLSLRQAVLMSAIGNFIGAFIFGVAVATTIGKGLVIPEIVNPYIIITGLAGAIFWVYFTTYFGLPISASHSLIGGYVGSAVAAAGLKAVIFSGITKVLLFIFAAPLLGMIVAFLFQLLIFHIFKKSDPSQVNKYFRKLQIVSASIYSIGHGTNDAQKTMGIIAILLFSAGILGKEFYVPFWVAIMSYAAIALGTIAGGWKVIKTMGMRITKLQPVNGFCAETAGSSVVIGSTILGIPVSTTHVISGSIIGVGVLKRVSAVRWGIARNIMWAWILTMPVSGLVGGLSYFAVKLFI
ncbi:inorganic phosphate transporter [Candidatus Woesearchaeota archaeon]|nr:inorganic phosphate transporter [Candidatus Woesearchaeota archaeon]